MTKELIKLEKQLISDKCQYEIHKNPLGTGEGKGFQIIVRFPNNYGASIVRHEFPKIPGMKNFSSFFKYSSYTSDDSEVEIAVIQFTDNDMYNYHLCYDTPITDDVLGHQSYEDTLAVLRRIEEL